MSAIIKEAAISEKDMVAQAERALGDISKVRDGVGRVIFGQESVVERTLVAVLSGGKTSTAPSFRATLAPTASSKNAAGT